MTHFSDGVRVGAVFPVFAEPGVSVAPISVYDVAPVALSATAVAAAQARGAAGDMTINGASVTAGVAIFDVPRAVSVVSANSGDTTQSATVFGFDVYGQPMSELIAFNGVTTVAGQKAFSRVTRVAVSASTAGNISCGSTDVLGLPIAVSTRNYALTAWDGAFVTTGTFAAAATTSPATTTTDDVRGTYLPPTATNGTRRLTVYLFAQNTNTQVGIYGVAQA
jgi:hypothetical protein